MAQSINVACNIQPLIAAVENGDNAKVSVIEIALSYRYGSTLCFFALKGVN